MPRVTDEDLDHWDYVVKALRESNIPLIELLPCRPLVEIGHLRLVTNFDVTPNVEKYNDR